MQLNRHKKGAMRAECGKLFRACEVGIDVRKNHRSCYPPPYIYANVFCIFFISLNIFQYNLYKISPPLSSKPLRQRRAVRTNKNSVSRAKPCNRLFFFQDFVCQFSERDRQILFLQILRKRFHVAQYGFQKFVHRTIRVGDFFRSHIGEHA